MSRPLRAFALAFALIGLPLAALAAAGVGVALHQVARGRDAAVAQTAGAVGALVAEAASGLRHEVTLLARDPALIEATARSDWATLARFGAPRIIALVRDGIVDLVVVRDATGAPLVQVPAGWTSTASGVPGPGAGVTLRTVNGEVLLLAAAAIRSAPVRDEVDRTPPLGTILMGRRLQNVARRLAADPTRPEVVLVAGDGAAGSTRTVLPAAGWAAATAAGRIDLGDESFALRRLGPTGVDAPDGTLWALVPETQFRVVEWKLRLWLAAVFTLAGVILAIGIWTIVRHRGAGLAPSATGGAATPSALAEPPRDREREASNAIALIIARGADLVQTAEATLDAVRRVAAIDVAIVYRLDEPAAALVLVAQRGLGAEEQEVARVRPLEGTQVGLAARSGQLLMTRFDESPPSDARIRALSQERGHRVQLALPIPVGERTWGVLALVSPAESAFSPEDIASLDAVAHQVGLAVERAQLQETAAARLDENARLLAEAKRRAAEYQALFEVAGLVGSTLDLDRVLDRIVDRCRVLMGVRAAGIFRLGAGGVLAYERGVGLSEGFVQTLRLRLGEGTTGRAARDRHPAWSADVLADPAMDLSAGTRDLVTREGYRSALSVPILRSGAPHGVLSVYWWEPHQPSPDEIAMLSALAGQAGIALENARLFAEAARQAERMRAVADLGRTLVSTLDAAHIRDTVAVWARGTLDVTEAGLYLEDPATGTLRLVGGPGVSERFVDALEPGEGVVGRAASEARPVWTSSLLADPLLVLRPGTRRRIEEIGDRSVLALPLVRERPFGALVVYREAGHRFTDAEVEYVSVFASQVAVALDNARLYAETARHLAETQALLEVAEILNSTLDPQRLLKQVTIKIAQVCRVDRCSIERWDGDRVIPMMSQFADGRRDDRLWAAFLTMAGHAPRQVPAHAQAIETRRAVVIPDTRASDLIPREWTETFGHRSYMVVPLIRQDAVLGVMTLDCVERAGEFERWQVDLAMAIAGQLALTVENIRLYGEAQERLRETTALLAVGRALSEPGPSGEVLHRTAREVARAFNADMVGVYLLDATREALVPAAGYHVPKPLLPLFSTRPFVLSRFPALTAAWRAGRAFWSADVKNDASFDADTFEGVDPHAVLLAPTMVRGESVGALFLVWWSTGRQFTPAEIRLVEGVASQVGLAMENAELGRQTQLKLEETERLLAVSRTLASTPDLETLPREFLRHVAQAVDAETAGMWLLDEDGEWMDALAGYHVPPGRLEAISKVRLSIAQHGFYAEAAATRRSVVSTDAMNDPRIPQALRDAGPHRTQLFVPIVAKDRMVGGFAAIWWETRRELGDGELRLMEAIASQAGAAVENARLFRDNQRRVSELSVLYELSRAVTGQLDQEDVLETVYEYVARLLEVRHMFVLLYDESSESLEAVLRIQDGVRVEVEPRRHPRSAAGLSGIVLETGRSVRTDDYVGECARWGVGPIALSMGLPHWLGVPMGAGDRTLGVLALRSRDRAFTERDQRVLANIADLAALALRSARLYEERARAHGELAAAQDHLVRTEKLRALGEMASGVAHDFNNVLAAILGRAQLLLQEVSDPKLRQWAQVIERAATDGARTVRRLQDFTRIRRDHPAVPVDLNQVIQQTLEATEPAWRQESRSRGIDIEVRTALATPLPMVPGDPAELREALTNVILNALDAMPGGGTLSLSTTARPGHVEVIVTDSGLGIPAAVREKIFDPFFTTKGPKGTGLGLSMTYGILSRHGATITVESPEGAGATFRLLFPVAEAVAADPALAAAPALATPALRCLVVDDEEAVAMVLGDMLLSAGHRVEVVGNGPDAIGRVGAERFDLVLTDLAMPGMTGWEVARAVKNVAPRTRVFLVSGFGVEVSPEDLRAHGVDLVLAKPLRLQDIENALAFAPAGGEGT